MNDFVAEAKAALEGVTEGPWEYDTSAETMNLFRGPVVWLGDGDLGAHVGRGVVAVENHYQEDENGRFIAAARTLVPALVAEVEKLRSAAKTLGKIIDDSLTDVLKATDSYDVIGEDGDGDWMLVFERLMELRPARDAALAEVERLRDTGPWMEHVERQRAMKRERDGECICNTGPDADGPDEFCPWHGRRYTELVEGLETQAAELERLRGVLADMEAQR
jgi:hypothetical protein